MKYTVLAAVTVSTLAIQAHAAPFSDLIVFSDSLADKGRLPLTVETPGGTLPVIAPPSNDGRFTDGTTWMEQVGEVFEAAGGQNYNMSVGGAVLGPTGTILQNANDPLYLTVDSLVTRDPSDPDDIPLFNLGTFDRQIASFENAGFDNTLGENPLFVISLGANDVFQRDSSDDTDIANDVTAMMAALGAGIQKVQALDTTFTNFIVTDLPFSDTGSGTPLDKYFSEFRAALEAQKDSLGFEIFDFGAAFEAAVFSGLLAGINPGACLPDLIPDNPADGFNPSINQCLVPGSSSNFLFADNTHPNSFIHTHLANTFVTTLGSQAPAPIPLPASLPLLGAAIAGFAMLRRRAA